MSNNNIYKIDNSYIKNFISPQELILRDRILQTNTILEAVEIWMELLYPDKTIRNGKPIMNRPLTPQETKSVKNMLCRLDRVYLALIVSEGTEEALIRIATNPWLFQRCREVQRNPDGYLDLWPRGHYKSTIVTKLGAMQELLINPRLTILIITYTNRFALEVIGFIKKVFEFNEYLKELFPDILYQNASKQAPADTWTLHKLFLKTNVKGNAASLAYSAIGGAQKTGNHSQLLIYDDAVTDKSVTTANNREKTIRYINTSANLGSPGQPINRRWFVGTRYHAADAYDFLMQNGAVIPRVYTATHNGRLDGDLVFLDRHTWETVYLTQDGYSISTQMFMNPNMISKTAFEVQNLKPYNMIPACHIFIFVDPATTKNKNSDYTSISVIGVRNKPNGGKVTYMTDKQKALNLEKYLLDGVRDRMNLDETWNALKNIYLKWEEFLNYYGNNKYSLSVHYESYAASRDIELIKSLQERDGIFFDIEKMGGKTSKEDRIKRLVPDLKAGNFKIPYFIEKYSEIHSWKVREVEQGSDQYEMMYTKEPKFNARGEDRFPKYEEISKNAEFDFSIQEKRAYPISRNDVEGLPYDYTAEFIEEFTTFPYSRWDDVLDSITRIYDIPLSDYAGEVKIHL
jgi:phage terminase large subunit-like protein